MAITFEEKSKAGRNAIIIALAAVILAAAGFFIWKFMPAAPVVDFPASVNKVRIEKEILTDPRVAALELFPEIPSVPAGEPRMNPFVEQAATSSEAAANGNPVLQAENQNKGVGYIAE